MRRTGPYLAPYVPSFNDMVACSTPDRRVLLDPLKSSVNPAIVSYDTISPNVHVMTALGLADGAKLALNDAYDSRTVAMKRKLSAMFDTLPPEHSSLCPYCSLDSNPDLDHFLPQKPFPEFALHPLNLIPICTDCNRRKGKFYKDALGDRLFLHPSTEPTPDVPILEADIVVGPTAIAVPYRIDTAAVGSPTELALILRHYERLELGERYGKRAINHLSAFKASVAGMTIPVISKTLHMKIATAAFGEPLNGWQPALYRAITRHRQATLNWLSA